MSQFVISKCVISNLYEITIKSHGKYHWAFQIIGSSKSRRNSEFGLVQNNKFISIFKCASCYDHTIQVYLNTNTKLIAIKDPDGITRPLQIYKLKNIKHFTHCKLRITVKNTDFIIVSKSKNKPSRSNLYIDQVYRTVTKKSELHLFELKLNPYVESINNEYLLCLIHLKQYNKAYKHVMQFKKGTKALTQLILDYYYTSAVNKRQRAHNLLKLLNDKQLCEYDLCFELARCSEISGDAQTALKYYQLFLDQRGKLTDRNTLICIGNMATLYYNIGRVEEALSLFLQLGETEMDRQKYNGYIGICYWSIKTYDKSVIYLQRSIERKEWYTHKLYELMINSYVKLKQPNKARKYINLVKKNKRCVNCGTNRWNQIMLKKETPKLRKCKGCKSVFLCSRRCQKHHWRTVHRKNCLTNYYAI